MRSRVMMMVAVLMLGLLVAPASANKVKDKDPAPGAVKDSGVFSGAMLVGKFRDDCLHNGSSTVSGPGIGVPTQARKNAYYSMNTSITSAFKPTTPGTLKICGRLTKMHSAVNGGQGAACGAAKGWDGKGTIVFPGKQTVWLKNLGWKVDVDGTWIMTGEANQAPNEAASKSKTKSDFFSAAIKANHPATCLTKGDGTPEDPKSAARPGATALTFTANYEIANKTGPLDGNQNVGPECKSGLGNFCLNDPKKPGASG